MRHLLSIILCIGLALPAWAASAPDPQTEMKALFDADQKAREKGFAGDWDRIEAEDAQRRARVAALIAADALTSGDDFYHAAYVYQHGDRPADYLKAHVLAMVAIAKGRSEATWIAAATLDRYLKSIGQSQIFGTQFSMRDGKATQLPYDRALIPDALRGVLNVPLLREQEEERARLEREVAPGLR